MPELISNAYRHCDLGHSWNESEHGDHQCPVCGRGVLPSDDQIPQQQMYPRGWLAWRLVGWGIALLLPTFLWGYWLWTKHTAHIGSAYAVALSPSGSQLWTGGVDGTVREWNMDSQSVVSTWPVLGREVPIAMAASSTGYLAIITAPLDSLGLPDSDHSQLFLRRTDGGKWKVVSECVQPHSFRWSGDGKRLVAINDSSVTIIDPSQGRATLKFVATTREEGHLQGVAFSDATGARVATCSARNVKLWDSETGEFLTCPITFRETGRSVDISPDGRWIVAGGGHHSAIGELHLQRMEQADGSDDREPIQASSEISQVAFVDDQHFLAVESLGGTQLFDVSTGKVVAELPTGSQQPSVSVNLDWRLMAVPEGNNVGMYSIKDNTIARERAWPFVSLSTCKLWERSPH